MRILGTLLFMACILLQLNANAQSSGWADSAGYKQQIMPLKSIKQVQYSSGGDTLYTVSRDSLYRIDHWDAVTGKLLKRQTVDTLGYKMVYSVIVSQDGHTYCVSGLQVNVSCVTKIYSIRTDSLLHSVPLKLSPSSEVVYCSGRYDSTLRKFWIQFESLAASYDVIVPSGTRYGGVLEYNLTSGIQLVMRSETGATNKWSSAIGVNASVWIGFYHKLKLSSKGEVLERIEWMKSILWKDSSSIREDLAFDILGSHPLYSQYALNYFPILTPDGKQYTMIDHQVLRHRTLEPYSLVSTSTLPFSPTFALAAPTNNHILISSGRTVLLFTIIAQTITDSLTLPFDCVSAAFRPQSRTVVIVSKDGKLRTVDLPFNQPTVASDFRADSTTTYNDSAITFTMSARRVPLRLRWDFGDGTSDTTLSAIHRYATPGTYTVHLFITDSTGKTDTAVKRDYITIMPSLRANFSASPRYGKSPIEVEFTDKSIGNITSWKWDFGDKQMDSVQHPKHTYYGQRYYTVTLTISDGHSVSKIIKPLYINADTVPVVEVLQRRRWISDAVSSSSTPGNWIQVENAFSKGILGNDAKLYVYGRECNIQSHKGPDRIQTLYYKWGQSITVIDSSESKWKYAKGYSQSSFEPGYFCEGTNSTISGFQIINFRNQYVTSFAGWTNPYFANNVTPSLLYFSNGRDFRPSGWTHDFKGAFLPDGTDIFLFSHGTTTSIQFFRQDSFLIAIDSIIGEVVKPLVSIDSQNICIISNLYSGAGDSARWIVQRTYSSAGLLLEEKHILKNFSNVRLTDAASLGWGEFLLAGWVTTTDSLGVRRDSAYLAKLGSDGRLAWEYLTPTWRQFKKLEKLSTGYYAAWGIPQNGFSHGFVAVKSDGTILTDNRLVGTLNGFSPSDFVVGAGNNSLWFIGSESVPNQGQRAAVYLCSNPMSAVTSVAEGESSYGFPASLSATVYPQPAVHSMTVRLTAPRGGKVRVSMVSSLGTEQVYPEEEVEAGTREFMISTAALSTGMYTLCVRMDGEMCVQPVVVVR